MEFIAKFGRIRKNMQYDSVTNGLNE